jgi:GNAT superfamily N-acetyltransferase
MAVAEARRGEGIGFSLLREVVDRVRARGSDLIWCNARTVALPFYVRNGFTIVGEEFLAGGGVPHYRALRELA